jgi:transposase-like protein
MQDTPKPDKRRKYDAAFRAEALRLAEQSRSTQAAARALNIDPKRFYQWQEAAQNRGTRMARVACFCQPDRCPVQRR